MMFEHGVIDSRNQVVEIDFLSGHGVTLSIKREDEIHEEVSGNKWRKLKYHLLTAREKGAKGILTFGGAFSNHIAAAAFAAQEAGLAAIGIIRGERVEPLNDTLEQAESKGMDLKFVSRAEYRGSKDELTGRFDPLGSYHHIPEGGADKLGVKGCTEILCLKDLTEFDLICCSSGTGTTAAGLYRSMDSGQKLRVYPALKGDFMRGEIETLLEQRTSKDKLQVSSDYHFGGYARTSPELFEFMREFHLRTGIRTDPIYTAKMLYGLLKDVEKGEIKRGTRILAIHTGGLQGIKGMEQREGLRIFVR